MGIYKFVPRNKLSDKYNYMPFFFFFCHWDEILLFSSLTNLPIIMPLLVLPLLDLNKYCHIACDKKNLQVARK